MKNQTQKHPPLVQPKPAHHQWQMRFSLILLLLGTLVLACDLTQFLASSPEPLPTETTALLNAESTLETTPPTAVPPITLEAENPAYLQHLPLLSNAGATVGAKGFSFSPTPMPTQTPNSPAPTSTITPTFTPTLYATITTIPLSYLCLPPQTPQLGLVTKVVDGDTIRVLLDGKEEKVRYIGIDAPESTTTQEPFGKEATKHNAQLVRNQIVELYRDVSETDRFGRLLRYVVTNSVFVNLRMIEEGYAKAVTYPPDVACATIFQYAERTARELGKGLWASATSSLSPNCNPAYPDVCIPSPPPYLSCNEISFRNFRILPPDPHEFDRDGDGLGCEQ